MLDSQEKRNGKRKKKEKRSVESDGDYHCNSELKKKKEARKRKGHLSVIRETKSGNEKKCVVHSCSSICRITQAV